MSRKGKAPARLGRPRTAEPKTAAGRLSMYPGPRTMDSLREVQRAIDAPCVTEAVRWSAHLALAIVSALARGGRLMVVRGGAGEQTVTELAVPLPSQAER